MAAKPNPKRNTTPKKKYYDKIRADQIRFDHRVQRQYDKALADQLEANWDPEGYGTVTLSKRPDGNHYGVDGQHRTIVSLRKDPDAILDAEIHEGLTLQEEAQMYLRLNRDRKAPRKFDNHVVALQAGEEVDARIHAEVTACGLKVAPATSAHQVGAVEALRWIAKQDINGGGLVRDVLTVAESAWGRTAESWDNMILRAVGAIINKNRATINLRRLGNILRKQPAGIWKASAIAKTPGGGGSQSRATKLANVIVGSYNAGLRTESKKIAL